jgi:hypothetical protein
MEAKKLQQLLAYGRGVIIGRLDEQAFDAVCEAAREELARLEPSAPRYSQMVNRVNFEHTLPALAIYRALRGGLGLEQEAALDLMHAVVDESVRRMIEGSWPMRLALGLVGRSRLLAWLVERTFTSVDEPHGWLASRPASTGAHLAMDIHQCGLVRYLTEVGAAELAPVLCDGDLVTARYMGLRLERSRTLSRGAEICDFRYYR